MSKEPPLHRRHYHASTPSGVPAYAIPPPLTGRYHRTDTFRSRRFSRPQRFAPHGALQACCTLLPVMGSTRFPMTSSSSIDRSKPIHRTLKPGLVPKHSSYLLNSALCVSSRPSEDSLPLSQKIEEMTLPSFPRAHPPFKVFPFISAVPSSPSHAVLPHHAMPPIGLPFTLLSRAFFFQFPSRPFPVLASIGVQVTELNLKVLSRNEVRCTNTPFPTYPCPILPWASQTPVLRCPGTMRSHPKIGPKPGRTLHRIQPEGLHLSHVLQASKPLSQPKLHQLS